MRSISRCVLVAITSAVFLTSAVARGEWKEPKDGAFTEKQLTSYIAIMKEWMQTNKAAEKALQGQSGLAAVAVLGRTNQKFQESITAHGMTQPEFDWMASKVFETWGAAMRNDTVEQMKADSTRQIKESRDRIAADKQKLAQYQQARKDGRKVLTAEEKDAIAKSSKEDQQSALDDAKQHADAAKASAEEAFKAEADAKAADAIAKNPPKDLSEDDRNSLIDEKKNAAESARSAAKDARDKEAEEKKSEAESRAKAAAAAARMKNPDLPAAEEKEQVQKENDEKIAELTESIKDGEAGVKLIEEGMAQQITAFEPQEKDKINPQNLTTFKKHRKEFEEIFGIATK